MVVALAACGTAATPVPVTVTYVAAPIAAPPPRPACVTPSDEAAAITRASADLAHVRYCVGTIDTECFALALDTGRYTRSEPPRPRSTAGAQVVTTSPELKVCMSGNCTALTPNILPGSAAIRGATNADGTLAVFLLGDAPRGKGYGEIWDVSKTRRAGTFRYARGEFKCGDVAMLDDTIYVSASQCGAPAARATLFSVKGKKVANVGGVDFGTFGGAFAKVDGTIWAFLEENGTQLVLQNVVTGKVVKKIDTSPLFKLHSADMGNPGESSIVRVSEGQLAVIAGAPATGSVALIDVVTGELRVMPAQVCK